MSDEKTQGSALTLGSGTYRRLFPELKRYRSSDQDFLLSLGIQNGVCDGTAFCARGQDDSRVPAGWPFFGQFIAHDITADRSPLKMEAEIKSLRNVRTPQANLECIYGDGPSGHAFLYERANSARFLLGPGGHDVPRNVEGIALVADPRNDSQFLINQFHVGMLRAHNRLVEEFDCDFERARHELQWTYQWLIIHEFLPLLVGRELMEDLLANGCRYFHAEPEAYIPIEFADAAYRYGHSQIRHHYQMNAESPPVPVFPDLLGFRPVPKEYAIDWTYFFDTPAGPARQMSKQIDGRLPGSLIRLPGAITGQVEREEFHSLAARDLQRGQMLDLPTGEEVARFMGVPVLTREQVGLTRWTDETPLWFYVLREAKAFHDGDHLGPVGGRIVGEVLLGIIDCDPTSYRSENPSWEPPPGRRRLGDLLSAG